MAPLITFLALASTTFAAVLETRQAGPGLRTDTFEELDTIPGVPQLSAVGEYNGLDYDGWVVAEPGFPILNDICIGDIFCLGTLFTGLRPQSGSKVAAAGIIPTLTQIGEVSLRPFGTISAGDSIGSFNLNSFFFGCLTSTAQTVVIPSAGCTITVTGFYTTGVQAPTLRYTFTPTSLTQSPLTRAFLPPSYRLPLVGLSNVTIGIAEADFTPALTILDIDNLVHLNRRI